MEQEVKIVLHTLFFPFSSVTSFSLQTRMDRQAILPTAEYIHIVAQHSWHISVPLE